MRKLLPLLLLALGAGLAHAGDPAPPPGDGVLHLSPAQIAAAGIEAEPLRDGDQAGLVLAGRVIPRNADVEMLPAPVAGVVRSLRVNALDRVAPGQLVATLYSTQALELQREFLDAAAAAGLATAAAQRERTLADQGIIAGRRALESATAARQAAARLNHARQALQLAGFDTAAQQRLQRSGRLSPDLEIRAPAGGEVAEQLVHAGERVEAGTALFRLIRSGPRLVELQASAEQAARLAAGLAATVEPCQATGRITAVGSGYLPASQTVPVRAEFADAAGCLRPDQYVQVRVARRGTAAVPEAALFRWNGRPSVFVREADGFRIVPAEGPGSEALVPGTAVVIKGLAALKAAAGGIGRAE